MSAYFITAIGTGVGKTFTTCALLHAARNAGLTARGYKPVISGWDETDATDTAQIIAVSGKNISVEKVSPWRFAAPLSPHRAAAHENKMIDIGALVEWSRVRAAQPGLTLIEGVGGVMVPLTDSHTTLDWMKALGLPVILTTGSYLGSISHTLTALKVLEDARLRVAALVMNETADSTVDFAEAQAGLNPFITNIPLRIFQPRVSSWQNAEKIAELLTHL
jgi:dethiobiotin synthetase